MVTASALKSLPQEWQQWIHDNLERGCAPADMAGIMVRDGGYDAHLARASIEEALDGRLVRQGKLPERQPMPQIETGLNTIALADRTVEVIFSLQSPRVALIGDLLSNEECDALVSYAVPRLERSPVVADADGKMLVHAHRTSRGAMLQRAETELVARIEARLEALTAWPAERGEGLQVLSYEKGNEYRPHFDWFDPALPGPRKHLEHGGQRVATIIMYLSEVEQGGGTSFPNIGLQVQPRKGSAVFFANTDPYGVPEQRSLHAGDPVERGVKVIATKWLRQRAYV